ncbi:MAG: serine hydrolase [Pseudomonadota bacterium]
MKPFEPIDPIEAGFAADALAEAVAHAEANETSWPRDVGQHLENGRFLDREHGAIIGPTRPRGGPAGLIVRDGRLVTTWGDVGRADMTFSVTKSVMSALAGIAYDRGLLPDLDAPVAELVDDGGFDSPQNASITWRHLLQQTSEWEGTLWDKPDLVDRNRDVSGGDNSRKGEHRDLQAPGTYWEYNDVRVNRLSLALMRLFNQPLPVVLKEAIMEPVGASDGWEWHGYENSWIELDGERHQSVSGGGHWGGGMFVSASDLARLGLLYLNDGRWGERQILTKAWIDLTRTPCDIYAPYGFLWWLNTGRAMFPAAPESSYFALGSGGHVIWVDPDRDMVAVMRWLDDEAQDGFIERTLAAAR